MRTRYSVFMPLRLALLALLFLACDRRVEPYVPPDQEPPPSGRPVRIPGLERPAVNTDPLPTAGARMGVPGVAQEDSAAAIRGEVRLGPGVAAPDGGVLFVIARGARPGPPLAVKRLDPGPFPMAFSLGPSDVMIQGVPFAGPIRLTARLDRDGDPLTRDPDDLTAESPAALVPGTTGIELILN